MYRIFIALFLILPFSKTSAQERNLKIITYNIWNGYDFGKDEDRRKQLNSWINDQNPGIVALQELCKYTPEKLAEDAKSWGHDYSILLKTTGYSVGLTSKSPITVKEKIMEGMHHGALHCITSGIDIFVIHFSPSSYLKRREEAGIILDKLKEIRKNNDHYLVLGDFNAHSPIDADLYDPNGPLLKQIRGNNKDKGDEGNFLNGNLEYAVISSLLAFPMLDVCQPFTSGLIERGSFPSQALSEDKNNVNEELIQKMERIDFILASPELGSKCLSARICNGPENYYLSDHYPVVAEFEF